MAVVRRPKRVAWTGSRVEGVVSVLSYEETMRVGEARYREVLDALDAAGLPAVFTQTGGMCAALEVQLETGRTLLITDADDTLSWDRAEQHGWGVGLYEVDGAEDADNGALAYAETESTSNDALFRLIDDVLMRPGPRETPS